MRVNTVLLSLAPVSFSEDWHNLGGTDRKHKLNKMEALGQTTEIDGFISSINSNGLKKKKHL